MGYIYSLTPISSNYFTHGRILGGIQCGGILKGQIHFTLCIKGMDSDCGPAYMPTTESRSRSQLLTGYEKVSHIVIPGSVAGSALALEDCPWGLTAGKSKLSGAWTGLLSHRVTMYSMLNRVPLPICRICVCVCGPAWVYVRMYV